ncbi:MAG: hypothetical protein ACTSQB_01230 [Candidatus Heimdallarchaeota archaeon]
MTGDNKSLIHFTRVEWLMGRKIKQSEQQASETQSANASSDEEEIIYSSLGSHVRREIISFIHLNEKVGFLELREQFKKLKIGSLYHQLNMMKELWQQDANKKYHLTELGNLAYDLMIRNKDQIEISNVTISKTDDEQKRPSFWKRVYNALIFIVLPRKVFQYLAAEPIRTFFEGLIIIGAMLYFAIDSETVLVGFYILEVDFWYYSVTGILALWLFLGLSLESFKSAIYKRKFNPLKLFTVIPFTLIPNLLVLFFIWLQTMVEANFLFADAAILIVISQVWALALTTTAVSQTEELTMNRSSLIVLLSFYIIYVVAFVLVGAL